MRTVKIAIIWGIIALAGVSVVLAADFDWLKELNIRAKADPSGFKAQLAARFKIGDAQINAVIGNVDQPGDAYMMLRLGEMSGQPVDRVFETYRREKGKGWGALAKSLGIKPGSPEFHALKRGHDLGDAGGGKGHGKKGGGKENGRGKKNK
jgi:hypothetical protein